MKRAKGRNPYLKKRSEAIEKILKKKAGLRHPQLHYLELHELFKKQ